MAATSEAFQYTPERAPSMLRAVFQFPNPERGHGIGGHVAAALKGKYPDQTTAWLRRVLADAPDALFGHADFDVCGLQPVRWRYTRNAIAMEGIGERGNDLVDTYWRAIHKQLVKETGELLRVEVQNRPMSVSVLPANKLRRYHVARMIVGTSAKQNAAFLDDPQARASIIERHVYRSLNRQANAWGITLPRFPVINIEVGGDSCVQAVGDNRLWAVAAHHVCFSTTLAMTGEWRIGKLTSKGFGVMNAIAYRRES